MKMELEDIKMLAAIERQMDAGEVQFVRTLDGERVAILPGCAEALGIKPGQTINAVIFCAMLEWNIAECERKIAERNARDRAEGE